jgi:hypothetical protein
VAKYFFYFGLAAWQNTSFSYFGLASRQSTFLYFGLAAWQTTFFYFGLAAWHHTSIFILGLSRAKYFLFLFWACRLAKYFFFLFWACRVPNTFFLFWACRVAKYFFFFLFRGSGVQLSTSRFNSGPKNSRFHQDQMTKVSASGNITGTRRRDMLILHDRVLSKCTFQGIFLKGHLLNAK